eukprot:2030258-Rhodomonas_salina.1
MEHAPHSQLLGEAAAVGVALTPPLRQLCDGAVVKEALTLSPPPPGGAAAGVVGEEEDFGAKVRADGSEQAAPHQPRVRGPAAAPPAAAPRTASPAQPSPQPARPPRSARSPPCRGSPAGRSRTAPATPALPPDSIDNPTTSCPTLSSSTAA